MKKTQTIIRWIVAGFFSLMLFGVGFHPAAILLLLSIFLMIPLPSVKKALEKLKIKSWLAILLSIILFLGAISLTPPPEQPLQPPTNSASSDAGNGNTNSFYATDSITGGSSSKEEITSNTATSDQAHPSTDASSTSQKENNTTENNPSSVGAGTAVPVNPRELPPYSGSPYVKINNNIPSFSGEELSVVSYEKYGSLDRLGRCGVCIASVGKDLMPTENRGNISQIRPTGWHSVQYDTVDGGYLYHRCHLIGYQLSGENANARNLITGTRYLNTEGMLPFENMIADYVKETGNHVAFRVTPIFEENNLLASGVEMEAYSIEDHGEGICFHVYCYNVQPGIKIDYADGSSSAPPEQNSHPPVSTDNPGGTTSDSETTQTPTTTNTLYVLNTNTKKFHYPSCPSAKRISAKNYAESTKSRDSLMAEGYSPCGNCDP